jgi:hypothetical protein
LAQGGWCQHKILPYACIEREKKIIAKLEYEDGICTSHEEKTNLVDEFYANLLGTNVDRENSIDLQALGLPSHDLAALEALFS